MRCRFSVCIAVILHALLPATSRAQFDDLAALIPELFDQTIVLIPAGHQAHFIDSSQALRDAGIQINASIVGQLATVPLSSSAGGFTYDYNEQLGIFERSTNAFGPIFTERAMTIGKGKWNFGVNYFSTNYDAIDSLDLTSGDLAFSLTHLDSNNDGTSLETFFEGDLILADAAISLSTNNVVTFGTYGVTKRFDLAFAVPLVSVDLDARVSTHILRQATEGFEDPPVHRFPDGTDEQDFNSGGTASGVGDILLRAKYQFASRESAVLAAATDLRLPTGDEDNLLGTGGTQAKLYLIGSGLFGSFATHVNLGYTFSSGGSEFVGELSDEFNFAAAFDVAVHPRVTIAAEILWRTLIDANQIRVGEEPFLFRRFDSSEIQTTLRPILTAETENLDLATTTVGLKVNLTGTLLLTADLIFSLTDDGLQDQDVVPLIGIDYSF